MPEGDAAVRCDKNCNYFQNGVFVRVNLWVSLRRPYLPLLVCLGAFISPSSCLFIYLFFWLARGGVGGGEALVMLLLRVLLGVREVKTLAPEAFQSAQKRGEDKTLGEPRSRRTLLVQLTSVPTILRQRLPTARVLEKSPPFPPPPLPSHHLLLLPPFQRLSLLVSAKCDEAGKQAENMGAQRRGAGEEGPSLRGENVLIKIKNSPW